MTLANPNGKFTLLCGRPKRLLEFSQHKKLFEKALSCVKIKVII